MSLANLMSQPLTIQKIGGGVLDEYGNTVASALGSPVAAVGYLELTESIENLNDRDTVVSSFQAWLPAETDVTAFDRLNFGSQSFEVDGEPWHVFNPRTGVSSHIICKLKVVQ